MTAVGVCDRCQYPERDHGVGLLQTCVSYKSGTGRQCQRCGCDRLRHVHYRGGDDCGTCGRLICPYFLTLGMRVRHVLFETMCYLLAASILLGIVLYAKWIF